MNTIVKEIAREAGFYINESGSLTLDDLRVNKFAELLITKAANMIEAEHGYQDHYDDWDSGYHGGLDRAVEVLINNILDQ